MATRLRLEAYWRWDNVIVGMGDTPEQDRHLSVMHLTLPSAAQFMAPVGQMFDILHDPRREPLPFDPGPGVPLLQATRLELVLKLTDGHSD